MSLDLYIYITIDENDNIILKGFVLLTPLQFYIDMQIDIICGDIETNIYKKLLEKSINFCKNRELNILSSYIFRKNEFIEIYINEGFSIDNDFDENNPIKLLKMKYIF